MISKGLVSVDTHAGVSETCRSHSHVRLFLLISPSLISVCESVLSFNFCSLCPSVRVRHHLSGAIFGTPWLRMEKRRMEYRYVDKQQIIALISLSGPPSYAYIDTEAWTAELFLRWAAGFRERYFVVEPNDSLCRYFEVPLMCTHASLSRAVIFSVA